MLHQRGPDVCLLSWLRTPDLARAADLGMQVALVDEEKNPGGVCLFRGCIPSKALLHVAKVIDEARHASAWGVSFEADGRGGAVAVIRRFGGALNLNVHALVLDGVFVYFATSSTAVRVARLPRRRVSRSAYGRHPGRSRPARPVT